MGIDKNHRLAFTAQAKEIVSKMTLEEKIYLMSGRVGMDKLLEDFFQPNPARHYNWYPYPAGGNGKFGVPEMKFCDGPRGVVCGSSTCFPVTMARGATFDADLEKEVGEAIASEIRAHGGNLFGGVCVNVPYNPGWGRSQEVYGEDPFHMGQMGAALVRGVQDHNVIACVKHFAFNSMEDARFKVDVKADKRTEREVFLPHFKDCVDAGAASVMSSYNSYDGDQCGHSKYLLTDVLKKEWGFDGFVMSDFVWGVKDTAPAANAGLDIEMCHTKYYGDKLVAAVKEGSVPEVAIDEAAVRIVRTLLAFTSAHDRQSYPKSLIACDKHVALARRVAEKAMTLVKNDGVLPLDKKATKKIAVLGPLADVANIGDHGSSQVFPPHVVTVREGISRLVSGCEIVYNDGSDGVACAAAAKSADAAILVVGYGHDDEGEFVAAEGTAESVGGDRKAGLGLHRKDIELIEKVCAANGKTVVVLIGGNMIMVEEWKAVAPSILFAYYPGMEGGTAIAETVFGDNNPGGKLPFAIARRESDLPGIDWEAEKITYEYYHGYTKLEKEKSGVSYPYGFGLSYTSFSVASQSFTVTGDVVTASCVVTNTGKRTGDEVIQFYVGFANSKVERPVKLLRGFARVTLKSGESRKVSIKCPAEKLAWFNPDTDKWEIERMKYDAYIGTSCAESDLLKGEFSL